MQKARQEWHLFLLAVQFMTRLPIPAHVAFSEESLNRAARYYPAVGLLVGVLSATVLALAALVLPVGSAVVLALVTSVLITGALHEDGLADIADGLGGAMSRDRALEIMRDSRVGAYGVISLILILLLKFALLSAAPASYAAWLLLAGHTLSRLVAVQIMATTPYARKTGAKFAVPVLSSLTVRVAHVMTLLILLPLGLIFGAGPLFVGVLLALAAGFILRRRLLVRLQGYTGDGLGAAQQISEAAFYIGVVAMLSAR